MADLRITELPELLPGQLSANDPLAVADLSASTTKKITAVNLINDGINLLPAGSIPADKILTGSGSVGTSDLADKSVTAPKLADSSTATFGTTPPVAGEYIGQLFVNQSGLLNAAAWDGTTWNGISGVVDIVGGTAGLVNIYATRTGADFTISADLDQSTGAGEFLAGPSNSAGTVSYRRIQPLDLPLATNTTVGGVSVSATGGLAVDGNGEVSLTSTVTPDSNPVVTYGADGRITAGRALTDADLPIATLTNVGAVKPGSGLDVAIDGTLGITNSVTPGTGTKVTFNEQGLITSTSALEASDIPDLDASKITSGTIPIDQIPDGSITAQKLADYCISYIQEGEPTVTDPGSIGMLWLQESTAQLRMWNGNSWYAVGLGRLVQENLRWGGLIDASTGLVTAVTRFGLTAGLSVGAPLSDAKDQIGGLYVVVELAGNNIGQTPGVDYDEGDWCLCIDQANGWTRIDTLSGGGGGGAQRLNELLDVTITSPVTGQFLVYNAGSGQWLNTNAAAAVPVPSVFGRTGAIVATNGDYDLGELGDVDLTTPPGSGQALAWNGTNWVPQTILGGVTSFNTRTGAVVPAADDYSLDQLSDVDVSTAPPTAGQVLTYNNNKWVAEDLSISGGIDYKGTINLVTDPAPAAVQGDAYINIGAGTVDASWTGIAGNTVAGNEFVIYNGTQWDLVGGGLGGGVLTVSGQNGVEEVGTAQDPVLQINRTLVDTWYTPISHFQAGGVLQHPNATQIESGFMSTADKIKLDTVSAGANENVQADWGEIDPNSDAFIKNKPPIPPAGVTSFKGRTGAVVPENADYEINQLSDVNTAGGNSGDVLTLVGTVWRPQPISIAGGITYKGETDFTALAPTADAGDLYLNNTAGTVDASWTGIGGETVVGGEFAIYDGTTWALVSGPTGGTVNSVTGQNGLATFGTASDPVLELDFTVTDATYAPLSHVQSGGILQHALVTPSVSGVGGDAGFMDPVDKEKIDGIAAGAQPGTVTSVTPGAGLVSGGGSPTDPILDVGAGTGIIVSAGDVSVNRGVVDTWYAPASHVGSGDAAHLLVVGGTVSPSAGFMSPVDKDKLDAATAAATVSTLMARDVNGDTAVNKITAVVFEIDALPALP